jgi:hypothetical protein
MVTTRSSSTALPKPQAAHSTKSPGAVPILAAACCAMALLAPGACCSNAHVLRVVVLAGLRAVREPQHHKGKGIAEHSTHGAGKRATNYIAARTIAPPVTSEMCMRQLCRPASVQLDVLSTSRQQPHQHTYPLPAQPLPYGHAGAQEHSALLCLSKQCRRRALDINIAAWLWRQMSISLSAHLARC